jgi:putative transposase
MTAAQFCEQPMEVPMPMTLDVQVEQLYSLALKDGQRVLARFRKELSNNCLRFVREGTDLEIPILLDEFEAMRSDGRAIRIPDVAKNGGGAVEVKDVDPLALLDPDDPSITNKDRTKCLRAAERLRQARTLRFYVMRYDEDPVVGRGHAGVRRFIDRNCDDARHAGFLWKPSPGAVLRAVHNCGSPKERPLSVFFNNRGQHARLKRWHKCTTELATEMVDQYWGDRTLRQCDVISSFYERFDRQKEEKTARGEAPLMRPTAETLRLWIKASENYWTWKSRFGARDASRRFKGRGHSIEATRPLEYVMVDHTRVDAWAVILGRVWPSVRG